VRVCGGLSLEACEPVEECAGTCSRNCKACLRHRVVHARSRTAAFPIAIVVVEGEADAILTN